MENVQNDVAYFTEHEEAGVLVNEIESLANRLLNSENESENISDEVKDKLLDELIGKINKISEIISKYLDTEVLLYQYIEFLIGDIFNILKRFLILPNPLKFDVINRVQFKKSVSLIVLEKLSFYFYIISKCVGVRRLINYAPNDVNLFEKITETIEIIQNTNSESFERIILKYDDHLWCFEFILLAWESLLVYTPFDLNTIWKHPFDENITFQTRILMSSMYYLGKSTKARDGAAMVISNLFSRKDVLNSKDFQYFLRFCQDILTNPLYNTISINQDLKKEYVTLSDLPKNVNNHLSIGVLMVLKEIVKRVPTSSLYPYLDIIEFCLLNCDEIIVNAATKKLRSSCLGRLALHLLPAERYSQKYRRKYRNIFSNLKSEENDDCDGDIEEAEDDPTAKMANAFDAPRVEFILSKILDALVDSDIRVRWACAKSVGRISARLPIELNEEILDHIIGLIKSQFGPSLNTPDIHEITINGNEPGYINPLDTVVQPLNTESENVVHGGCLAIAEILREGLIHPHMLSKVLDTTILSLSFEVWRGKGSAGTSVRDASCFICWAIARTFTKEMLNLNHVHLISMELVNVSLFDSSVNCRRAACSALQELVGRLGTVPKGLDLLQMCNYYTVSNRKKAFVEVCQKVSTLGFYSNSMLQNILRNKIFHPEIATRELASLAIYRIVSSTPHLSMSYVDNHPYDEEDEVDEIQDRQNIEFLVKELIEFFFNNLYTPSTTTTHGALRGLTRLLYLVIDKNLPVNLFFYEVLNIPVTFEKKRLFRSKGSNIIRQSICKLITVNCKLIIHTNHLNSYNSAEDIDKLKEIIDYYILVLKDCLRNFALEVQVASVEAFDHLFYIVNDTSVIENLYSFFIDSISSKNDHIAARRGYALVFSSIPLKILTKNDSVSDQNTRDDQDSITSEDSTGKVNDLLFLLCSEIRSNIKHDSIRDAKTRQFALLSILSILYRLNGLVLEEEILQYITDTLVACYNDYEIDSRGDVGSWVRELSSEVITYILGEYLFHKDFDSNNTKRKNSFKNLNKRMATDLTRGLVALALENLEHVRSRSTFLFCHLFTNQLSNVKFKWIWNRIFYNIPYEQLIFNNSDIISFPDEVFITVSTSSPNSPPDEKEEDLHKFSTQAEMSTNKDYGMNMYIKIDNRLLEGFNMLFDISKNLIKVISIYYETNKESEFQDSETATDESTENIGTIPVSDCEYSLEHFIVASEKVNSVLRIPGWSAAPLTFKTFLWVLLIPSYTSVAFRSLIKIVGENNKVEVAIHSNNTVLILEDVLVEFISENKDALVSWKGGPQCLETVLRDCSLQIFRESLEGNDYKTTQKLANTLKILLSHRLLDLEEWSTVIDILITDARTTTNYAYLKSIIRCFQVLLMYNSDEISGEILQTLLRLLNHQYPTIRSYVASHLTLALSIREDKESEEAMEILDSCSFHVESEDKILNVIQKLGTILKV